MLIDEGVNFAIRDFGKLEGVYIPAQEEDDIPIVGINLNRPITRQRFTAAHELCHYLRDSDEQMCPINGSKTAIEKFADNFASGILMPLEVLRTMVIKKAVNGYVNLDDILEISNYFGVSFESCLFRIAFSLHAVEGNPGVPELRKQIRKYKPDYQRQMNGYDNLQLYEGLLDSYEYALRFIPNGFASNVFQNNYIYNDSRMEDVDIEIEKAAEIVTDIRLKTQNSEYCTQEHEAFLSIAGHVAMYSYIFQIPVPDKCSVYDTISLHQKLYSCFPYPEYGGKFRDSNSLVLGGKFETVDCKDIIPCLIKAEDKVKSVFGDREKLSLSSYIKKVIQLHHELTVIHPFGDGNGRTLRAFLNLMMVRNKLTPVYIKVENKVDYITALSAADLERNYVLLFEFFAKAILRANTELTR